MAVTVVAWQPGNDGGALVWYWQHAHGLGPHVVGVLKAFVWPAFLVYDALRGLRG